ncbi:MAG: hypothetical protein FJY97_01515 [candidate division Zixibacteria bacterium]|nr:hypothetical protein [candidate division Zixibacteria bacterium]
MSGALEWTGWGQIKREILLHIPEEIQQTELGGYLASVMPKGATVQTPPGLSVCSFEALIRANRQVLLGDFPVRLLAGT